MKLGFASSIVQSSFMGTYKAFSDGEVNVTSSADVRFWLSNNWSGDDFGGDASDVVGYWSGDSAGSNVKTDDTVNYIEVKTGQDQWERIYVS